MIQSFRALLIDSRGRLSAYCFPSSTCLLDHATWGNDGVNYIASRLVGKLFRVAWVGDMSRMRPTLIDRDLYRYVRNRCVPAYDINRTTSFNLWGLYFVNHTKRSYIDCTRYFCDAGGENGFTDSWVLHPLPLLTAIGNGRGEDDYCGINQELVGSWAMDMISFSIFAPDEYKQMNYVFYEGPRRDVPSLFEMSADYDLSLHILESKRLR